MAKGEPTIAIYPLFQMFCCAFDVDQDALEKFVKEHRRKKKQTQTYKAEGLCTILEVKLMDYVSEADPPITSMAPIDSFYHKVGKCVVHDFGASEQVIERVARDHGKFGF